MSPHRVELEDLLRRKAQAGGVDLSSRRRVLTDLSGTHVSGFRGRGMEFEEHRVYQAGDELRAIDWRVTARTGTPHVRIYREERERPVLIVVDYRAPMWFGTRGCFKAVLAARAAAMLAWAAQANGDRVGGLIIGRRHAEFRPAGGRRGVLNLLHGLAEPPPVESTSTLEDSLQRLIRTARPGTLVAILSDFRGLTPLASDLLRRLGRHAELILGFVSDPLDRELPPPGRYAVSAPGHREVTYFDTRQPSARQRWHADYLQRHSEAESLCLRCRGHWLDLRTEDDLGESVARAFGGRRRRAA